MKSLIFCTGNDEKFEGAKDVCAKNGIGLSQNDPQTDEIQSEDPEKVALDKATKAFAIIGMPLVITDDSWVFTGLSGFPGVYVHSIDLWFKPEDYLHLTLPLTDRSVVLTQTLVFQDAKQQKIFTLQSKGKILKEIKGKSAYPSHTIVALDGDGGKSIAEAYEDASYDKMRASYRIWHDFTNWYTSQD